MRSVDQTIYISAARTATPTAVELSIGEYLAMHLIIDVTAVTATPSIVVTIAGFDPLSTKYYTLLESAAITTTGTNVLKIGFGTGVSANAAANDALPDLVRITITHGDADSITYTASAKLMRFIN
jgi:hypothetical protein